MSRINHVVILMLEDSSFDRLFGFSAPPHGDKIENILALESPLDQLLNAVKAESSRNGRLRSPSRHHLQLMIKWAPRLPSKSGTRQGGYRGQYGVGRSR
jgi:phospholipase C